MIIDKIENHKLYAGISDKIAKAFSYINKTDLINIAPGTYKIDNDNIFAIVQEYDTKDKSECKLEGHFKYIDIQYIIDITGEPPFPIKELEVKKMLDDFCILDS